MPLAAVTRRVFLSSYKSLREGVTEFIRSCRNVSKRCQGRIGLDTLRGVIPE
jgi:hypothetical protein